MHDLLVAGFVVVVAAVGQGVFAGRLVEVVAGLLEDVVAGLLDDVVEGLIVVVPVEHGFFTGGLGIITGR